jgi:hypothetical protein
VRKKEREKNGRVKKLWARKKCSSILVMESARNRCKILNLYKTNFKRKIMDRSKLLRLCIVYPFLMRAMYLGRQWFSPYYMDSTCLLDLVRTSSPAHFNGHPFWPYYLNDTSVTCQSTTGIPLDTYFLQMYKDGVIENKILNGILMLTSLWGAYEIAHKIRAGSFGKLRSALGFIIIAFCVHAPTFHLISHYQNDLAHINGNVMHHSSYYVGTDNAAMVATLPPGLVFNFSFNYIVMLAMMYVIMKRFQFDAALYLGFSVLVVPAKLLFNMKVIHPFVHTQLKSWYATYFWPWSYVVKDYHNHVLCHHVSGYCLGEFPGAGNIMDYIMYWHGKLYSLGLIKYKSIMHYCSNILFDYFLLAFVFVYLFACVYLVSPLIVKVSPSNNPSSSTSTAPSSHPQRKSGKSD